MQARPWQSSLRDQLNSEIWIKGAVNYDEDLHFSTYYLRGSGAQATAGLYPGYSTVVAFYEGFTETYYLLREECRRVAVTIVDKALKRPTWLPRVLREIGRRSDALQRIFPSKISASWLARQTTADIVALYRRHDKAHRGLYRYARLPEALDRGVNYFTEYLMSQLRLAGLSEAAAAEAFATLSAPSVPSILAQEIMEFDSLVEFARQHERELRRLIGDPGRSRMSLSPELLKRIELHRKKWQFLPYHGYGRRQLATLGEYISRLLDELNHPRASSDGIAMAARSREIEEAREELLQQLQIDPEHCALFRVYPEIGAAKLYRRYAQLRNFYALDLMLAEIARRLSVSEWTIRCMLPEEIIASLEAGRLISDEGSDAVLERLDGCMYVAVGEEEHVLGIKEAAEYRELARQSARRGASGEILRGVVACRGKVAGPCKIVIRADDVRTDFPKGTILVSESTDPDLVPFLRLAGGVLTEQGGVTSHAAIICRELGVPTVIGVEGLLERVSDGDWLEIDAERGEIRVKKATALAQPTAPDQAPQTIGAKAFNLGLVRSLGFHVPRFVVLDFSDVERIAAHPGEAESIQRVQRVLGELSVRPGDKLAVRSSAIEEDAEHGSAAGQYSSLLDIAPERLTEALAEFVKLNRTSRSAGAYSGSVIVQRMIEADCAGVCLTSDVRTGHAGAVIIEMAAGGNSEITGGTIRPDRVVVDRRTGDILDEQRAGTASGSRAIDVTGMVRQFLQLESRFGRPLDIEWAMQSQELYILQARPIVSELASQAKRSQA